MTFTDDDLKRLKIQSEAELPADVDGDLIMVTELKAFISRLEAAEAYAEFRIRFSAGHDGEKEKLEAWRKAAGK